MSLVHFKTKWRNCWLSFHLFQNSKIRNLNFDQTSPWGKTKFRMISSKKRHALKNETLDCGLPHRKTTRLNHLIDFLNKVDYFNISKTNLKTLSIPIDLISKKSNCTQTLLTYFFKSIQQSFYIQSKLKINDFSKLKSKIHNFQEI